jgi:hypothetical protein
MIKIICQQITTNISIIFEIESSIAQRNNPASKFSQISQISQIFQISPSSK